LFIIEQLRHLIIEEVFEVISANIKSFICFTDQNDAAA